MNEKLVNLKGLFPNGLHSQADLDDARIRLSDNPSARADLASVTQHYDDYVLLQSQPILYEFLLSPEAGSLPVAEISILNTNPSFASFVKIALNDALVKKGKSIIITCEDHNGDVEDLIQLFDKLPTTLTSNAYFDLKEYAATYYKDITQKWKGISEIGQINDKKSAFLCDFNANNQRLFNAIYRRDIWLDEYADHISEVTSSIYKNGKTKLSFIDKEIVGCLLRMQRFVNIMRPSEEGLYLINNLEAAYNTPAQKFTVNTSYDSDKPQYSWHIKIIVVAALAGMFYLLFSYANSQVHQRADVPQSTLPIK